MIFIVQIILAVLLVVSIVLQSQGSGLSTAFGGSGQFYRSKRSIEKMLVILTGVFAFLFAFISLVLLLHR